MFGLSKGAEYAIMVCAGVQNFEPLHFNKKKSSWR